MKRIILLVAVVAIVAATLAASSVLSIGSAQEEAAGQAQICAPWPKAWYLSEGQLYFSWYRWCYDPALYDPYYESSWYTEQGNWEWGEKANLCPESGTCTMSPAGMRMTTGAP